MAELLLGVAVFQQSSKPKWHLRRETLNVRAVTALHLLCLERTKERSENRAVSGRDCLGPVLIVQVNLKIRVKMRGLSQVERRSSTMTVFGKTVSWGDSVGISSMRLMVAHTGLEPVISALRGQRVNQLHQCAVESERDYKCLLVALANLPSNSTFRCRTLRTVSGLPARLWKQ